MEWCQQLYLFIFIFTKLLFSALPFAFPVFSFLALFMFSFSSFVCSLSPVLKVWQHTFFGFSLLYYFFPQLIDLPFFLVKLL